MKKNVLIIGSQGYLGSRLSVYLRQHDFYCATIDTGFFKDGLLTSIDDKNTIELPFPRLALLSQNPFVNCIFEK